MRAQAQEYVRRDELHLAEAKYTEAAEKAKHDFGEEDPRYFDTLKRLAWVYNAEGKYSAGRQLFTVVYRLTRLEAQKIKFAQTNIAAEPFESAAHPEPPFVMSAETIEKYCGSNDPELVPLFTKLAHIYEQQGAMEKAETSLLRIWSIARETAGEESVASARARIELAKFYACWAKRLEGNAAIARKNECTANLRAAISTLTGMGKTSSAEMQEAQALEKGQVNCDFMKPSEIDKDKSIPQLK